MSVFYEGSVLLQSVIMSVNKNDTAIHMNSVLKELEHIYSNSHFPINHLFLSDVEQRRTMLKLMSTRGRQVAASVFYEPNQLKPRTCFYNKPLHVLLSDDESTKIALGQVNFITLIWYKIFSMILFYFN
jgi:hypothetical protein